MAIRKPQFVHRLRMSNVSIWFSNILMSALQENPTVNENELEFILINEAKDDYWIKQIWH